MFPLIFQINVPVTLGDLPKIPTGVLPRKFTKVYEIRSVFFLSETGTVRKSSKNFSRDHARIRIFSKNYINKFNKFDL